MSLGRRHAALSFIIFPLLASHSVYNVAVNSPLVSRPSLTRPQHQLASRYLTCLDWSLCLGLFNLSMSGLSLDLQKITNLFALVCRLQKIINLSEYNNRSLGPEEITCPNPLWSPDLRKIINLPMYKLVSRTRGNNKLVQVRIGL